jgi:CubicO group peptidase (beta-lactamase class C family)
MLLRQFFAVSALLGLSLLQPQPELPNFSGQLYLQSELQKEIFLCQGMANRAHQVPVNEETVFDIASLNKSFIANLVLQAVGEGRWKLDDHLNDLLAGYNYQARFDPEITLHQMLCHRSGLADYDDLAEDLKAHNFRKYKRSTFRNAEYLSFLAAQEHGPANQKFYYSNFAYHILPILLEAEYEQEFQSILSQKIGEVLGMKNLHAPSERRQVIPNLATAYTLEEGKFYANEYIDLSLGRRIFCGAPELMKWLEAGGGRSLLSDSLASLVMQNHLVDISEDYAYGYGWVTYEARDQFKMGNLDLNQSYFIHGGSTEGFQSLAISVNEGETKLVLLANNGDGKALFERAKSILKNIYDD